MTNNYQILLGDSLEVLAELEDNVVDSIVTDPPYGLAFMNKKWDYDVPSIGLWTEVLRVLKPGGHLLSFGGTRTYHRMVVNIEDAGFEIRDQIQWLYGSGFPKSHNIGKKLKEWEGFGTALKPANEPIVLARKPLSEKTIVDNVLKWGTGGLNIDECRVATEDNLNGGAYAKENARNPSSYLLGSTGNEFKQPQGRWPANVILDEDAGRLLDEQSLAGGMHSAGKARKGSANPRNHNHNNPSSFSHDKSTGKMHRLGDTGGASRFFFKCLSDETVILKTYMQDIKCKSCSAIFQNYPSNKRKYCSTKCAGKGKRTTRPKCKVCGNTVRLMRNIYCSRSCRNKELGFQERGITSYSGLYWKLRKLYPDPEPCISCGKMGEHRHHPDYSKPFEIVWMCAPCHRREHQTGKPKIRQRPGKGNALPIRS